MEIGDKVKFKKEVGGGSGTVVSISGSYVIVKTKSGNKSYHISDIITESINETTFVDSKGKELQVNSDYYYTIGNKKRKIRIKSIDNVKGVQYYDFDNAEKMTIPTSTWNSKKAGHYMTKINESLNEAVNQKSLLAVLMIMGDAGFTKLVKTEKNKFGQTEYTFAGGNKQSFDTAVPTFKKVLPKTVFGTTNHFSDGKNFAVRLNGKNIVLSSIQGPVPSVYFKQILGESINEGTIMIFHYAKPYTKSDKTKLRTEADKYIEFLQSKNYNVHTGAQALYFPDFIWAGGKQKLGKCIGVLAGSETIIMSPIGQNKTFKFNEKLLVRFVQDGRIEAYRIPETAQESINEGNIDISKANKGAEAVGGGYGPFIKMGTNYWKNSKTGKIVNDAQLIKLLGGFKDFKLNEDQIEGGKGDDKSPDTVDQSELMIGIKVEMEHTNNQELAREIATDHLTENPTYYTDLIRNGMVDEPEALKLFSSHIGENKMGKLTEGRNVTVISKDIEKVAAEMKKCAGDWKKAEGAEKDKHLANLKSLTAKKKKLQAELNAAVEDLDRDAELVGEALIKQVTKAVLERLSKK